MAAAASSSTEPAACKGGMIERMGYSEADRMRAFLYVCLPLRVAIAVLTLVAAHRAPVATAVVVLVVAMVAVVVNLTRPCKVWWDRSMHATLMLGLVLDAIMVLYGVAAPWSMSLFLFADVVYGAAKGIAHFAP